MNRTILLAAGALLVSGCGDSKPSATPDASTPDASTHPTLDGSMADASTDVPDAAVPGTVTLRVVSNNGQRAPLSNLPVVFLEPGGALAETTLTDTDGMASGEVSPGGAALVFMQSTSGTPTKSTYAVLGVEPGDVITVGGPASLGSMSPDSTMTITVPPHPNADVNSYVVQSPCGFFSSRNSTDVSISSWEECAGSPFSVVASAYTTTERVGVLLASNITYVAGGTSVLPGAFTTYGDRAVQLTGVPAAVDRANGSFGQAVEAGSALSLSLDIGQGQRIGETVDLTAQWIDGLDQGRLEIRFFPESAAIGSQSVRTWVASGDAPVTLDVSDLILPWLGAPTYNAATRTIAWPHEGTAPWDATRIEFDWETADERGYWTVLAPPGVHSITLPEVPDAFASWLPDGIVDAGAEVDIYEASDLDWDSARPLGFDRIGRISRPSEIAGLQTERTASSAEPGIE